MAKVHDIRKLLFEEGKNISQIAKMAGFDSYITGWIKPQIPVNDFLAEYSRSGGSHHSAIVYGDTYDELLDFGKILGCKINEI
ncbi:MAG: hypothetical protein ACYCXQ_12495 [Candidatus Humimicrobiaceae bacterium]